MTTELLPLVAKIPSAAARCKAQAKLWGAIVDLDLETRQARRSGEKGPPASELRTALTNPFVLAVITATEAGENLSQSQTIVKEQLLSCVLRYSRSSLLFHQETISSE